MGSLKTISFVSKVCFLATLLFVCGCASQYANTCPYCGALTGDLSPSNTNWACYKCGKTYKYNPAGYGAAGFPVNGQYASASQQQPQQQQPEQQQQANKDSENAKRFLLGGLLGMAASGAGDIGDPRRDLALRGLGSGLQNSQQNEAIQNSGQVNVNINNANQPVGHKVEELEQGVKARWQRRLELINKKLKLTPHQYEEVKTFLADENEQIDAAWQDNTLSEEKRFTKTKEIRKSSNESIKKILTPMQLEKWKEIVDSQSQVSSGDNQKGQDGSSKFGFINVTADDPTFEVFADGAFVGNSPAKLKLSEGPHTIEVRKDGFKDYKKEIRVADGSELNLRAVLEKQ